MKLNEVFGKEVLPMKTIQKKEHQRPPLASKFIKKAGSKFVKGKIARGEGRVPNDIRPRYNEVIPPTRKKGRVQ